MEDTARGLVELAKDPSVLVTNCFRAYGAPGDIGGCATLANGTTLVRLVDQLDELAERRLEAYRILGPRRVRVDVSFDDIRSRCSQEELYGWADRTRDPGGS